MQNSLVTGGANQRGIFIKKIELLSVTHQVIHMVACVALNFADKHHQMRKKPRNNYFLSKKLTLPFIGQIYGARERQNILPYKTE